MLKQLFIFDFIYQTKDPYYKFFSFSGASTIRAFKAQNYFITNNDQKIEDNQMYYYPEIVSASWLFCR